LFAASVILLAEKVFLQFVAINFHQKALADRLHENRVALKALDRLSNAQPLLVKKPAHARRGHKSPSASVDLLVSSPNPKPDNGGTATPGGIDSAKEEKSQKAHQKKGRRRRKARKAMASVIVDQVCPSCNTLDHQLNHFF
jgi:hypothetical protein